MSQPAKLFYVYAQIARDEELRDELEIHLSLLKKKGALESFHEGLLDAGSRGEDLLHLIDEANVILLLVSPNLMAGAETNVAFQRAMERFERREVRLIPIILRPTDWKGDGSPFGNLVPLPSGGKPVTSWGDRDTAWVDVVQGLRGVLLNPAIAAGSGSGAGIRKGGPSAMPQTFDNGHALLIGVGGDLPVTVNDAKALYDLLVDPSRAAYPKSQVKLLPGREATRKGILEALDSLIASVEHKPEATVIVYYSGHGWRVDKSDVDQSDAEPSYYLLANGYKYANLDDTAVTGDEFSQRLGRIKTRKLLVLLDCCHSAGIAKSGPLKAKAEPIPPELLGYLDLGRGQAVLASSEEDQLSYIPEGSQLSLFTQCLLEAMAGAGGGAGPLAQVLQVIVYVVDTVFDRSGKSQRPLLAKATKLGNFPLCFVGGGRDKGGSLRPGPVAKSPSPGENPAKAPSSRANPAKSAASSVNSVIREANQRELELKLKAIKVLMGDRGVAKNILDIQQLDHDIEKTQARIDELVQRLKPLG